MGIFNFAIFCYLLVLMLSLTEFSIATDTLTPLSSIRDGETMVSAGEKFQLGFFSAGNSNNRYLGIWYYRVIPQTIVWVANRDSSLNDSSGVLRIGIDGNLILVHQTKRVAWSTNIQNRSSQDTIAQLLDSGNLVVRDESKVNAERYLWQSFDYPSDTLLAGMTLGRDSGTDLNRYLTSWKTADDPSPGEFFYGIDPHGLPQLSIYERSVKKFRSGPWNGAQFSGIPLMPTPGFNPNMITNSEGTYYGYGLNNVSTVTRTVLTYYGTVERSVWNSSSHEWHAMHILPSDPCDNYRQCGPNSICAISNFRICSCLTGYIPQSLQDWEMFVWSGGCVREYPLNCSQGEGFIRIEGVKMPDLLQFWINTTMTLEECQVECLKNCSCTAYANSDATGRGSGCLLWYGDLVDAKRLAEKGSQNLYIRVTASYLDSQKKKKVLMAVIISSSITLVLLSIASCIFIWRSRQQQGSQPEIPSKGDGDIELPIFSVAAIAEATNNFSYSNKIGEGGFGSVYKGQLLTGQEIAVKRLSENSNQGLHEFKNEVLLIAKLQHRNLVRLLGGCIQGEERMLIYEYMCNGSLSSFIFDNRCNTLAWSSRFNIIVGIARGLLYLHRDSRLRIVHRDLKASNVLLDSEMNPKISDFGIARAFQGDQLLEKTKRVIGTYGYMSPEYLNHGFFSTKSDVFSFGVLVLEIVSGKRNRDFCHHRDLNLLRHAWKLWIEGKALELVDEKMEDSTPTSEVLKCIQVGLLCVQQHPEDRPTMSSVLLGLDSESAMLPRPKQPGFYTERSFDETEVPLDGKQCATNKLTVTNLVGR